MDVVKLASVGKTKISKLEDKGVVRINDNKYSLSTFSFLETLVVTGQGLVSDLPSLLERLNVWPGLVLEERRHS